MKGPEISCIAVRRPDKTIFTEIGKTPKKKLIDKIPVVRGAAAMITNLVVGYKCLMRSAEIAFDDGDEAAQSESKFDKWLEKKLGDKAAETVGIVSAVIGSIMAIVLFMIVPTFLTGLLNKFVELGAFKAAIEGVLKIAIFIGYLYIVTRLEDIHRVFEYHGAEHKTIACYEAGEELTVENVRKHSRFHPRCGTSFMFIVLIVSIIIFSFVPWGSTIVRAAIKLALLPLVMGISYEILKYAGRHENIPSKILSAPGMCVQRLTAFEPHDDQIEIAIAAMNEVIPDDRENDKW